MKSPAHLRNSARVRQAWLDMRHVSTIAFERNGGDEDSALGLGLGNLAMCKICISL